MAIVLGREFNSMFCLGIPPKYLYSTLFIVLIIILFVFLFSKIKNKWRIVQWMALIEYLFVVICSTIVFRPPLPKIMFSRIQLIPFWTYKAVINNVPGVSLWDIILNIILFLPFGFLVSLLFPNKKKWTILIAGIIFSLLIETSQYLLYRGIAQFDDVMHNTIGFILGLFISRMLINIVKQKDNALIIY